MMSKNVIAKKPYCKVCHDAGKPEIEYTSHWVKDLAGKTTCPTLLNTECRYCYKTGHTTKFCSVLAKNNKERERADRRLQALKPEKQVVEQKKPQNVFAALCGDSDSEEEVTEQVTATIEYPTLLKKIEVEMPKVKPEVKTGWAAIAAKPAQEKKPVEKSNGLVSLADYVKPEVKVQQSNIVKPVAKKSWADESDSEYDDDEDELPEVNFDREYEDDTW